MSLVSEVCVLTIVLEHKSAGSLCGCDEGLMTICCQGSHRHMLSGLGRIYYVVVTGDKLKAPGRHPA